MNVLKSRVILNDTPVITKKESFKLTYPFALLKCIYRI